MDSAYETGMVAAKPCNCVPNMEVVISIPVDGRGGHNEVPRSAQEAELASGSSHLHNLAIKPLLDLSTLRLDLLDLGVDGGRGGGVLENTDSGERGGEGGREGQLSTSQA